MKTKRRVTKIKRGVGNTYAPVSSNFQAVRRFWLKHSLRGDLEEVRTTFNVDLYLSYLDAIAVRYE